MKKTALYYFSAFVSGTAVMAVEMSSTRLLAPYFGNSLYVWTNVIGIIMVALAAGYYFGGRLADRHPEPSFYFSLFFVTGIWTVFIPFFAVPFFEKLIYAFSNMADVVLYGSFIAVLFLFSLPMVFLGMIVPFTVKMVLQHVNQAGSISGKISMVSTMGSLVGTFLPAFVLIPVFGTTKTFVLIGIVLMLTAAMALRKIILALVGLACIGLFWLVPPVYANDTIIYSKDSAYSYIFITEDGAGVRRLHVNSPLGTQSIYDPSSAIPEDRYYYSYFGVLPAMLESPKTVLILGHAGGTFTRIFNTYYPELSITGVELDPAMSAAAEQYMGLLEADVDIVHEDARTYLLNTSKNYDLILIDTYQSMNIPAHLATQEFFALAGSHLNEGGIVALNAASGESEFLDVLENSIAMHFENSAVLEIPGSYNSMILGSDDRDFSVIEALPVSLVSKGEYLDEHLVSISFDPTKEVFTDEKSTRVEILTNQMEMEIFKDF